MADIKIGDITVYEDDDGKAVWEFEGKVQSDIPLDTDAQNFAGAINELKKLSEAGGGDDWQPPDWWIPVPEPGEYDIYILILAVKNDRWNTQMKFDLILGRESDNKIGHVSINCDFGDGTVNSYNEFGYPNHTYTEEGQYLIHIIADENTNCWRSSGKSQALWQIVKTGEKIAFVTDYNEKNNYYPYSGVFPSKNYLKYVQINHPKGLPINSNIDCFQGCYTLRRIDLKKKISGKLPNFAFHNCYGLFDVSKILNGDEITSIGDYVFQYCYNLQKIIVSEDCTFGTNCFQGCYSLYPRPDGSIN